MDARCIAALCAGLGMGEAGDCVPKGTGKSTEQSEDLGAQGLSPRLHGSKVIRIRPGKALVH